jgi:hypothetical protein
MKTFGFASLFVALTLAQVGCEEPASTKTPESSLPATSGTMEAPAAAPPTGGAAAPAEGETKPATEGEAAPAKETPAP